MAKTKASTPVVGENFDKLPDGAKKAVMEAIEHGREMEARKKDPWSAIQPAAEYWEGTRIRLPSDPSKIGYRTAATHLNRLADDEEAEITVVEKVDAFIPEGAVAFAKALSRMFGGSSPTATQTMFGENPPQLVNIKTGVNESMNVFWGAFTVASLPGTLIQCGSTTENGRPIFLITGKILAKHKEVIHELAEMTRQIVREESIYKGKAISLASEDGQVNLGNAPIFKDVSKPGTLIFPRDLEEAVRANLLNPIERRERCRQFVPLRRGILLEGPPGCGKTLLGSVAAKKAVDNGWTFITVENASAFKGALQFAANYQPAVVFIEDIDKVLSGKRTPDFNDILNTLQGLTSNDDEELIVLVTTNHVDEMNPVAIRPGRFSVILNIKRPDEEAVIKLLRLYGGSLIDYTDPLEESGRALKGEIPATIREAVIRATLYALARQPVGDQTDPILIDEDIRLAALSLKPHTALLADKPEEEELETRMGKDVIRAVKKAIDESLTKMTKQVSEIHDHIS